MTASVTCPYCEEDVPVKIELENRVFEDYIEIEGYTWTSDPLPRITVCYKVDLEALARDIDRLIKEEYERKQEWDCLSRKLQ